MKKILTFILIGCLFLGLSVSSFAETFSYVFSNNAVAKSVRDLGDLYRIDDVNGNHVYICLRSDTKSPFYYQLLGAPGLNNGYFESYSTDAVLNVPFLGVWSQPISTRRLGTNVPTSFSPSAYSTAAARYLFYGTITEGFIPHNNDPIYDALQAIYDSTLTNLDMLVNFNLIRQPWDSEHPFKSLFNVFLNTLPESNVIGFEMNLLDQARQFLWTTGLFHDTTGGGHKFSVDPVDKTVTVDDEEPLPMPESRPYDITTQPYDFVVRPVTYNTETQTYYYGDWIRVQNINPTYIGSQTIQNYEVTNDYVINLDNSTVDQSSHDYFDNSVTTNNYYTYSVIINNDSSVNVGDIDIPVNFTPVGIIGSGGLSAFWDRFKDIDFVGFLAVLGELLAMIFLINPIFLALINFLPLWATTIISSLITLTVIFIIYKFIRKSLGGTS